MWISTRQELSNRIGNNPTVIHSLFFKVSDRSRHQDGKSQFSSAFPSCENSQFYTLVLIFDKRTQQYSQNFLLCFF